MKITYLLFLILVFMVKCENNNKDVSACGISNPLANLPWLKDLKNDLENETTIVSAEIILYTKDNSDYFYVSQNVSSSYDMANGKLFNCGGTLKYVCGGNQPVDSCSIFLSSAQKISSLWKMY